MKAKLNALTYAGSSLLKYVQYIGNDIRAKIDVRKIKRMRDAEGLLICPTVEEVLNGDYCFVLSTGRCGTGLLSNIFEYSDKTLVYHNPKPVLDYASSFIHYAKPSIECLKLALISARFDHFLETFRRGRIYIETNNRITFFAPAIYEVLPNSKFIHLVRDPRSYVRSGMRRGYFQDSNIQYQRLDPTTYKDGKLESRIEKITWEWNEINTNIERFKNRCDPSRILTIKSEDMFFDISNVGKMYEYLNIENPLQKRRSYRKMKRKIGRPVNKQLHGSFPNYERWSNDDRVAIRKIATLARSYGYEL